MRRESRRTPQTDTALQGVCEAQTCRQRSGAQAPKRKAAVSGLPQLACRREPRTAAVPGVREGARPTAEGRVQASATGCGGVVKRLPPRPEWQEQAAAINLLKMRGWKVWRVGQRNARGTQDAGVPDCIAIHPRYGLMFYECKRERMGRQSAAQKTFEAACVEAGVRYVCGPVTTLIEALEAA